MLFKTRHLEGIRAGAITLAYRKWKKPTVKNGSLIKTAIGRVEILDVSETSPEEITAKQAAMAGFDTVDELMHLLDKNAGTLYRIELRYHSPDPRLALRNQTGLTDAEFSALSDKLARLDRHSKTGPWTWKALQAIRSNPRLRAADLADKTGFEKEQLKLNVRKLKNLGLTVSHHPGYTLSPRGRVFLDRKEKALNDN